MEHSIIEKIALLFGKIHNSSINIENLSILNNLDESPTSFSLDYEVMVREIQKNERMGYDFVGIFHSHPSNANTHPSEKDRQYMKNWPFPYIWVIGKNKYPSDMQIYYLYEETVCAVPFRITSSSSDH